MRPARARTLVSTCLVTLSLILMDSDRGCSLETWVSSFILQTLFDRMEAEASSMNANNATLNNIRGMMTLEDLVVDLLPDVEDGGVDLEEVCVLEA
jgi:hypothetical protein